MAWKKKSEKEGIMNKLTKIFVGCEESDD